MLTEIRNLAFSYHEKQCVIPALLQECFVVLGTTITSSVTLPTHTLSLFLYLNHRRLNPTSFARLRRHGSGTLLRRLCGCTRLYGFSKLLKTHFSAV